MAAYTTIDDPEAYFQVQLYTGNGSANHAITLGGDTDMQPDFVWIKNRDATDSHCLFDAVRGATKLISSDTDAIQTTDADTLDSFTSDGFQVDADVKVNTNTEDYVSWNWKAGTTSGITTNGSTTITPSSYSFNTTSGFSILQYGGNSTGGAKLAHGIAVPKMVFVKSTSHAGDAWAVYHEGFGNTAYGTLDTTAAWYTDSTRWNDTDPDSVNFTLGSSGAVNNSAKTYIAYCFADVQGFSKFGSYEGNGNANGTFVYTGFRPAFVMTKSIDSTSSWHIFDNKREGDNIDNDPLVAEATTVEATTDMIDLVSNGFKIKIATDPNVAETYVYAAFAEAPFVNSEGVPCNAR